MNKTKRQKSPDRYRRRRHGTHYRRRQCRASSSAGLFMARVLLLFYFREVLKWYERECNHILNE